MRDSFLKYKIYFFFQPMKQQMMVPFQPMKQQLMEPSYWLFRLTKPDLMSHHHHQSNVSIVKYMKPQNAKLKYRLIETDIHQP